MALHFDLSANELRPASVFEFIRKHATAPPGQDLLFKVGPKTFELFRKKRPKGAVTVSAAEARKLNAFLGKNRRASDYAIWKKTKCKNCGRELTFFDVFESARQRHGDKHVKHILGGSEHHVHIQKKGQELEVNCTACGTHHRLLTGYDGPEY